MKQYLALAAACSLLMVAGCSSDKNPTGPTDTVDPVVTITQPLPGANVSAGTVVIIAHATDSVGVTKVSFYDGTTKIADGTAVGGNNYQVSWTAAAGAHTLKAVAYDAAGNTGESTISVTVTGGTGPTNHHGQIQHSETWYPAGNPHVIIADVYVEDASNSPVLTIMPGCVIQFAGDYELYCGYNNPGAIVAEGKTDSLITFTTTSNPKTPGSWHSVSAYSHSTSAVSFKYCTFEYGGSSSGYGELYISDVSVKIANCSVLQSGSGGIKFDGAGRASQFTGNTVSNCAGHAIEIDPEYVRTLGGSNTFANNTNNDVLVRFGTVKTTCTWLNQGIPYFVNANVAIEDAANSPTLTIAPGCTIKCGSDVEFYCGYNASGAIVAEGTAGAPIVFTTNTNPPTPGDWRGVRVYSNSTSATSFNYCTIEYGGSQDGYGEFYVEDVATKMTNCTVRQSGSDGVRVDGTGRFTQFTGNTISNCGGHAINLVAEYVRTLGGNNTYSSNTNNDILIRGGTVSTTGTWLNQGVPYTIAYGIAIEDASSSPVLTIAPGTTVKLQSQVEFYVGYSYPGGLIADGTLGAITFTSSVASPSPGDWRSVSFYGQSIDAYCKLKNCTIEYAGDRSGNVYMEDAVPEITGCTIRHSENWGIYMDGPSHPDATALETDNTFSDNPSGDVREP